MLLAFLEERVVENLTIELSARTATGSRASRRYRREGKLPTVVYSRGGKPFQGVVDMLSFLKLAERTKPSQAITLKSDEGDYDGQQVLVKDIQQDGLSGRPLHVDFQLLHKGEAVVLAVPLKLVGEAPGVKLQGGILTAHARDLLVSCIPANIPELIEIDVTKLKLGDRLTAKEIVLPEGVALAGSADATIANVVSGRAARLASKDEGTVAAQGEADAPAAAE
jgi:large subunit ribosomal protein L25